MATTDRTEEPQPRADDGLTTALAWLDALLARAVSAAQAVYGADAAVDLYRGVIVGHDEPWRLLARAPGLPLMADAERPGAAPSGEPLRALRDAFGLSAFDVGLCIIALAPEIDLRYERLYGYLQDDVGRRWPTVDLALSLLCASPAEKLARRDRFAPDAPLMRHGVIALVPDTRHVAPPLLAHRIKLDDVVVRLLLGQTPLGPQLASVARLVAPGAEFAPQALASQRWDALRSLVSEAAAAGSAITIAIDAASGSGSDCRAVAAAIAAACRRPLLELDGSRPGAEEALAAAIRYASLRGSVVDVHHAGDLAAGAATLSAALADAPVIAVVSGSGVRPLEAHVQLALAAPDAAARRAAWACELARAGALADEPTIDAVAQRFRLDRDQIAAAAARAAAEQRLLTDQDAEAMRTALLEAARAQGRGRPTGLARPLTPTRTWSDLVVADAVLEQLRELCAWVGHRSVVHEAWGFDRKLGEARGLNALFCGPPGTGKTLSAEVVAAEVGLDLYRIDLASIVSKYIGETEKNIAQIFEVAQNSNAILLFDEADALFGKRSEVRDAHDRYANIEISYLLTRMETYDGVSILTTNRRHDMDPAFVRRLQFAIDFPIPNACQRLHIWQTIFPAQTPLAHDVDLTKLAGRFALAGGNIRNIAVAAAFLAAADKGAVSMTHLLSATRTEYRKLGTLMAEGELASGDF